MQVPDTGSGDTKKDEGARSKGRFVSDTGERGTQGAKVPEGDAGPDGCKDAESRSGPKGKAGSLQGWEGFEWGSVAGP